jgi:cytoskeleton-associated protein 5
MCYELYGKKECLRIIIDSGVKNKNLKSVAECLDEVADYIVNNGVDHIMKKDYKLFVDMADNKDKSVRENSLKVFGEAYAMLGEKIWSYLKDVPLKVKGLLE